ncbi:MAG: DUF721 domain-containing protein [Bacteroidetes bacterium]|nr:DUF721 domain-containing protein [Bacteroidota bacterium]
MVRKSNEQSLGEVIKDMIDQLKWSDKINEQKIVDCWAKIMGANIMAYTGSIELRKKTLTVHIKSAALKNELNFGKSKIIASLNKEMGSELIKEIVFI